MAASMANEISLFAAPGHQTPYDSLRARPRSSILVGLSSPGGFSDPSIGAAENLCISNTKFEAEHEGVLGIPVLLDRDNAFSPLTSSFAYHEKIIFLDMIERYK